MTTRPDPVRANLSHYHTRESVREYGERLQGLFPAEAQLVDAHWPPPPARVLDLGCGAARTTIELHRRGYDVTGIDLSETLLGHARRRHPELDLRLMDATALAFDAGVFDAALFSYNGIDCLYPVTARERCFREVHRVLKPGGVFQLSTHNAIGAMLSGGYFYLQGHLNTIKWIAQQVRNPYVREWFWRYADDGPGPQYLYSAPPSHTERLARSAGFEVVQVLGADGETDRRRIARHQQHVHFLLRKA